MSAQSEPERSLVGLFEEFEAYRTVSSASMQSALKEGLVVVDTNVLLNLYRYDDVAREDLFKVFEALGDRLFVPHQVMKEFWRNRENVLQDRLKTSQETVGRLERTAEDAEQAIREWVNRLAKSATDRDHLLQQLSTTFDAITQSIEHGLSDTEETDLRNTADDPVLTRLNALLSGKVGRSLPEDEHAAAVKEGLRRVADNEPPGYKDKDKSGDDAAGDYLVWLQALNEVARREPEALVFVTGDTASDDWWRKERGQLRGPRVELHAEALASAKTSLIMLRPTSLVEHARTALDVDIEEGTLSAISRTDDTTEERAGEGWTPTTVAQLMQRLQVEGPVQFHAIEVAASNGGLVTRDQVYEIGTYPAHRTLRGFTRPARRIMQDMQDGGVLLGDVPEPLETVYDPTHSYVLASGFKVPPEIVACLVDAPEDRHVDPPINPQDAGPR